MYCPFHSSLETEVFQLSRKQKPKLPLWPNRWRRSPTISTFPMKRKKRWNSGEPKMYSRRRCSKQSECLNRSERVYRFEAKQRPAALYFLRRTAIRYRLAPLRAHPSRYYQGYCYPMGPSEWLPRRSSIRLGHSRSPSCKFAFS